MGEQDQTIVWSVSFVLALYIVALADISRQRAGRSRLPKDETRTP
jgi:hypothetical protein